ncbi:uncharacterized protein GGS22DRAFT_193843 [Annulohypoxylon maeteangense]|uniref:uncharacterized protein n=1 Tax=Annulohypoxylon maeteangense TaxID=1927788 RepID=UPI0020084946|nr:uncharacterized protein GGS22DRAFT_193843 [Annulohypoxylon maeteangense]KAI0879862.1 hypothetical protein GGS22DRAFT_193843 [Annulohypoxylon maeteangense]
MASMCLPEILLILGRKIHNRNTLFNLCLVSKAFNEIFSGYYYQEISFCEHNVCWLFDVSKFPLVASNRRCLKHVKHFTFYVYVNKDLNTVDPIQAVSHPNEMCQSLTWWIQISNNLAYLLPLMPHLESFTWVGYPLYHRIVKNLQKHYPGLKSLTVVEPQNRNLRQDQKVNFFQVPIHAPDRGQWGLLTNGKGGVPLLPPFGNLERLHLHHIWGMDLGLWRNMSVQVLINSPRLLGFLVSGSTRWRLSHHDMHQNDPALHPAHFLRELCKRYRKSAGKPLSLKCVHLGHYMFVLRAGNSPRRFRPEFADEH